VSIWAISAVSPSEESLWWLLEDDAEEDSSLDMRIEAKKHNPQDLPSREDLRVREKAKEKRK
jgi:hypothetical protein